MLPRVNSFINELIWNVEVIMCKQTNNCSGYGSVAGLPNTIIGAQLSNRFFFFLVYSLDSMPCGF